MSRSWQLLRYFLRQDLEQRYAGQLTGVAWVVLGPLLQLLLFSLVFGYIFKARIPGLEGGGYVAFLALGMWPWFAFSEAVLRAGAAVTDQSALLGKVAVPAEVLIAARATAPFLLHGAGFVVVLLGLAFFGPTLHWSWMPWAIVSWLLLYALALGVGLLVAALQVFLRDLAQILGYLLAAIMFLSPILYTRDMAPQAMAGWLRFNPIAGLIEGVRDSILFGRADGVTLASAALGCAVLIAACCLVYRRLRPHLRDFL